MGRAGLGRGAGLPSTAGPGHPSVGFAAKAQGCVPGPLLVGLFGAFWGLFGGAAAARPAPAQTAQRGSGQAGHF